MSNIKKKSNSPIGLDIFDDKLKILSKDGSEFTLDRDVLEQSKLIKNIIKNDKDADVIKLPITSNTLQLVSQFLKLMKKQPIKQLKNPIKVEKYRVSASSSKYVINPQNFYNTNKKYNSIVQALKMDELVRLINDVNFLDIKPLLKYLSMAIAVRMVERKIPLNKNIHEDVAFNYIIPQLQNFPLESLEYSEELAIMHPKISSSPSTSMKWAAEYGLLEIVKHIVSKGVKTGIKNQGLRFASWKGHLDIVKFLVSQGANPRVGDGYDKDIPLITSAGMGHLDVVKYLVSKGANPRGKNILAGAAAGGYMDVVKYLVSQGAGETDGDFALERASKAGQLEVVKYLVWNLDDEADASSGLIGAFTHGHLNVVKYLMIAVGAGNEALERASEAGQLEVVKYIMGEMDVYEVDIDEAIRLASRNGHLDVVKYLKYLKSLDED